MKHRLGEETKIMGWLAMLCRNRRKEDNCREEWDARKHSGTYSIVWIRVAGSEYNIEKDYGGV